MEITQIAVAGTVESSDILITVEPTEADEIQISLESSVEKQFGQQIKKGDRRDHQKFRDQVCSSSCR